MNNSKNKLNVLYLLKFKVRNVVKLNWYFEAFEISQLTWK